MYLFDKAKHIHYYEGKPLIGTSGVTDVLSAPLTWWASGLACNTLGWIKELDIRKSTKEEQEKNKQERFANAQKFLDSYEKMNCEEYLKLLDKAYRAHSNTLDKAAKKGTDLHAEAENWVKSVMQGKEIVPHEKILPFVTWSKQNVKRFLWSEAHCYSTTLWCGGITDCGVELNDGSYAIIDFKSAKDAYPSHFFQIAGYDLQISENGLFSYDGKHSMKLDKPITKHIVIPFGMKEVKPVISEFVEQNREMFKHCLALYKVIELNQKINN
jgi:hypothetical protein